MEDFLLGFSSLEVDGLGDDHCSWGVPVTRTGGQSKGTLYYKELTF